MRVSLRLLQGGLIIRRCKHCDEKLCSSSEEVIDTLEANCIYSLERSVDELWLASQLDELHNHAPRLKKGIYE